MAGVVAGSSSCCPVGSVLDNVGECCPPGKTLDACGTCGGKGYVVDFLGSCCEGELDAGGRCCPSPLRVDQFGVCKGVSNTGMLQLVMNAYLPGMPSRHYSRVKDEDLSLRNGIETPVPTLLG